MARADCFHCGLPVPRGAAWTIRFEEEERPLCCAGCDAVAREILALGLGSYYLRRSPPAPGEAAALPFDLDKLRSWDQPKVQEGVVRTAARAGDPAAEREVSLLIENLSCAACVWLAEKTLGRVEGVRSVAVNFSTRRADVRWSEGEVTLSALLSALARIGLVAHPFDPGRARDLADRERRDRLLRFLVAGALGMQVMTLAVALYAGQSSGMEPEFRQFFRWTSLALTVPVLFYSGLPFLRGMAGDLRRGRAGMDVPVGLGLLIAFCGSSWATVTGAGEVYFDSVSMFVFLLHGARLLENGARARAARDLELLERPIPAVARRLTADGKEVLVANAELRAGDRLRVRPGEIVPADGRLLAGHSIFDEALLTGESLPVPKGPGDGLVGGSVNIESAIELEVTAVGAETVLASLERLVERARGAKPALARLADRVAARFSLAVLALAAVVAAVWMQIDPARVLPTVIAVLVVSCPCALSLATPLALAASGGALARRGLLILRESALETLARVDVVVFDKTGTLTQGRPRLVSVEGYGGASCEDVLALAAGLERGSEHPLARAVLDASAQRLEVANDLRNHPGRGVVGRIGGETCAVGAPAFVAEVAGVEPPAAMRAALASGATAVAVARGNAMVGLLRFEDELRSGARDLIDALARSGVRSEILSGDHSAAVRCAAAALGIDAVEGGATPERKVARIRELVAEGRVVAMVGDGINDSAALAAATVSVAMGSGAFLAARSADAVLVSSAPSDLAFAFEQARRTLKVLRGNFVRALAYNAIILPVAAAGFVPPWAAALGMTASSAVVVLNAMRLRRASTAPDRRATDEKNDASAGLPELEPAGGAAG